MTPDFIAEMDKTFLEFDALMVRFVQEAREYAAHSIHLSSLMTRHLDARAANAAMVFEAAMLEREQRLGPLKTTGRFNALLDA